MEIPRKLLTELAKEFPVYCGMETMSAGWSGSLTFTVQHMRITGLPWKCRDPLSRERFCGSRRRDQDLWSRSPEERLPAKVGTDPGKSLEGCPGRTGSGKIQSSSRTFSSVFEEYAAWGADLTLSGHFHGGTIRLPVLGGVMTPQYQFFYPRCAGEFELPGRWGERSRMIVGRGLGTHSINIRLNDKPQVVVIRLCGLEDGKSEKADFHVP